VLGKPPHRQLCSNHMTNVMSRYSSLCTQPIGVRPDMKAARIDTKAKFVV
jgi:hypothetical protein